MQRMKIDEDIKPLSEVKTGITKFVKHVQDTGRPLIITQHGKGVAVLMDAREFEKLQEKIELLSDVQQSISQIENGDGIEHKSIKSILLRRIQK